jgi:hypothetical protein
MAFENCQGVALRAGVYSSQTLVSWSKPRVHLTPVTLWDEGVIVYWDAFSTAQPDDAQGVFIPSGQSASTPGRWLYHRHLHIGEDAPIDLDMSASGGSGTSVVLYAVPILPNEVISFFFDVYISAGSNESLLQRYGLAHRNSNDAVEVDQMKMIRRVGAKWDLRAGVQNNLIGLRATVDSDPAEIRGRLFLNRIRKP